ncbi:MAG: bifunctional DNA-formamidopyrimidine glycosylase/DNA-(apurinic or apyrimidinic site) lyase [Desulfurellaceae bacterium]|nr:bifunctional DNA-formamidopyrimidine glycosylase/DNA-(apurinic or apyrimidinic site) lyase [Desulfurellaceae bacterium]
MPELPEVETIARKLRQGQAVEPGFPPYPTPLGRTVTAVWLDWPRAARPSADALIHTLPGHRIDSISRRGKYLIFGLRSPASARHLLIHLKMSGRLHVLDADFPREKHVHFAFSLDNGYELRFNDARKFGRVYLVDDLDEVTGHLGPEPLEETFTLKALRSLLDKKSGGLKTLLLDQSFIAGIGNIYADEALWRARIHPLRRANTLHDAEIASLRRAIRAALRDGLKHGGAAIDWVYPEGRYQDHFRVYGQVDKPCRRCKTRIERILVGQRSTHFCPTCQLPDAKHYS